MKLYLLIHFLKFFKCLTLASTRYEPILLALLKRREAAAGALVKAKEQAQELKAQLAPLTEEAQRLKLQKACLEEKLKLIHMHWREDAGQYKVSNNMERPAVSCRAGERD